MTAVSQIQFHIDRMTKTQVKADYHTASKELKNLQEEFPEAEVIHPQALSLHSFKFYNYPNYGGVFDPDRSQPHYFGIAALDENDYFEGGKEELFENQEIIVINIFGVDSFEEMLQENGYQVLENYDFDFRGGIEIRVWER